MRGVGISIPNLLARCNNFEERCLQNSSTDEIFIPFSETTREKTSFLMEGFPGARDVTGCHLSREKFHR
jgi:hypothetical protein